MVRAEAPNHNKLLPRMQWQGLTVGILLGASNSSTVTCCCPPKVVTTEERPRENSDTHREGKKKLSEMI
jgi:hypothetical protein